MKCIIHLRGSDTWTNLLTFEPDPDHNLDAGTGLLSPILYRLRNFAALSRLPASCAATLNFTSRKSHVYVSRGFIMVYSLSRRKTFVGGKCALPNGLLVVFIFCCMLLHCCDIQCSYGYCRVLSLSDCKYSLNLLIQTRIE